MITCGCGRFFHTAAEFFAHRDSAECPKNVPSTSANLMKWISARRKRRRKPEQVAPTPTKDNPPCSTDSSSSSSHPPSSGPAASRRKEVVNELKNHHRLHRHR